MSSSSSENGNLPKRKLKDWIGTWLKINRPISESPTSFLLWSGLFCISAVTKRKIKWSTELTKRYTVYPTMYLIFVCPPGVGRKTKTLDDAEDVIRRMNKNLTQTDKAFINFGPTTSSASKLVDMLAEKIDGSMTLLAGEFGNLVKISPEDTYDFFSKMFDHSFTYEYGTRQHGVESVVNPSLNIFGCTTPDWMSLNQGYITGGGFAARTVFIFETKAFQRRLFWKGIGPELEEIEETYDALAHDLAIIGQLKGEFKAESEELEDKMEEWYQGFINIPVEKGAETFKHRKHVHVIRTAMLLSLSQSNSLIITNQHFEDARNLCEEVEKKLGRGLIFSSKNPYVQEHYKILDYIVENGPVTRTQVQARFWQDVRDPGDFASIIETLLATGMIEEVDYGWQHERKLQEKKSS